MKGKNEGAKKVDIEQAPCIYDLPSYPHETNLKDEEGEVAGSLQPYRQPN